MRSNGCGPGTAPWPTPVTPHCRGPRCTAGAARTPWTPSCSTGRWNTLGHIADWCQLYVRTDTSAAKHKGISCLLVDMTLPGIEVRPLVTITGDPGFSELFFTDVRLPASALLGPLHEGWKVATTTLAHERAGVAKLHLSLRRGIRDLIET